MTDEIIAEVHAIKDAIGAEYAQDINALFEHIKRGEADLRSAGVVIISPPSNPPTLPNSALQRTRFARR